MNLNNLHCRIKILIKRLKQENSLFIVMKKINFQENKTKGNAAEYISNKYKIK